MKKFMLTTLAIAATSMSVGYAQGVSVNADAKVNAKTNAEEIAASKRAVAEQNANIAVNRQEKAAAKAEGDLVGQASQSLQIGANKVARGMAEVNHDVHVEMQEEGVSNTSTN